MKIIFDNIIFSLQKAGGISVYWSELLSNFNTNEQFDKYLIEMKLAEENKLRQQLNVNHFQLIHEKNLIFNRILKAENTAGNEKHIFHSSYYRLPKNTKKCCQITTIHDFMPELFGKNYRAKLISRLKYRSIKESDGVICVSENTKKDLLKLYPEFENKQIKVIHNGASDDFFPIVSNDLDKKILSQLPNPFCIFIGKRDLYKNFEFAVNYVAHAKDIDLVIVGGGSLSADEVHRLNARIKGRYRAISYASNADLNVLYNHAEFLFYPSEYEGFGIPLVEAQKAGCPFIAQKSSSLVELVENKDLLLDELTIKAVDECRKRIKRSRNQIVKDGLENGKRFSWTQSYAAHVDFYKSLYS